MIRFSTVAAAFLATPAVAMPPLACEGRDPEWVLTLAGPVARFDFAGRKLDMEIPQSSVAEGREKVPVAYTLIHDFDTAIALVDEGDCALGTDRFPLRVHVLTQRGQTPILLTGCCGVAE